jgi:hypothetical protein
VAILVLIRGTRRSRRDTVVPHVAFAVSLIALLHSSIDFSLQVSGYAIVVFALVGVGLAQSFQSDPLPRHRRRRSESLSDGIENSEKGLDEGTDAIRSDADLSEGRHSVVAAYLRSWVSPSDWSCEVAGGEKIRARLKRVDLFQSTAGVAKVAPPDFQIRLVLMNPNVGDIVRQRRWMSLQRAPVSARYIDFGPGIVDEDQPRRIKPALTLALLRPASGHVGKVVLAGAQAFCGADAFMLEEVPNRE